MSLERRDDEQSQSRHRWIVEVFLVIVIIHSVILTLWLAPSSPIREAAGERRLASYVNPYFQQGRDVVGIGKQRVDESFSIRAFVVPDGRDKGKPTEWIDLTARDTEDDRHHLAAPRAHVIARRLATNLNRAMIDLTEEQRKIVEALTADDLPSTVTVKLQEAGGRAEAVRLFQAYDQMAAQFTSLYAQSRWEGRVVQVQFRVGRRTIPPRGDREVVSRKDFSTFSFGWRRTFRGSVEARTTFDSYVEKR